MHNPEMDMNNPALPPETPQSIFSPQVVTVTDLGPNNRGTIGVGHLSHEQKQNEIERVSSPECVKKPTNRFGCVDGRKPEHEAHAPEGHYHPQIAGGPAISETAADMMVVSRQHFPKSYLIGKNTRDALQGGIEVVVHGDTHKGKAGCGANVLIRPTLEYNAEHAEIIVPTAWFLGQQLGLDKYLKQNDISKLIDNGAKNASHDKLWDISAEETIDVAVENGAHYEELVGDHKETAIVVNTSETANEAPDAFVASLGEYKARLFARFAAKEKPESEAALRMMAVILFNIGVPKQLTAEDQGNGEALPVVVLGNYKAKS